MQRQTHGEGVEGSGEKIICFQLIATVQGCELHVLILKVCLLPAVLNLSSTYIKGWLMGGEGAHTEVGCLVRTQQES